MCIVFCGNAGSGGRHTVKSNRGNRITAVHLASSQRTPQSINNTSMANTVDLLILSLLQRQFTHATKGKLIVMTCFKVEIFNSFNDLYIKKHYNVFVVAN